ncbi:MAG: glycosyltransferase family 39 protein [Candidatus Nomurabacteria bacterium]|jgi:4-amino-4-deoxy-L-arabinose transferase-like glycosyltransferase|nr:glycosyltransferase family 39 protein [Candidatus Nomurabacteria bacterium]
MMKLVKKYWQVLVLVGIGLLYIALCCFNLTRSIWFDESFSAGLVRFSFGDIFNLTAADVHPPLYYFALKVWEMVFGHTDFAMRFMSVLFGAIAIVFAFLWLRRSFGFKKAAIGALAMALSPMLVRYGQEMRMYTMVTAIVFAATYVLTVAVAKKDLRGNWLVRNRFWIIYGVLVAAAMWTHYFAALAFVAHLGWLITIYRGKIFRSGAVLGYGLAVALFLPWLPLMIRQTLTSQTISWIPRVSADTFVNFFSQSLTSADANEIKNYFAILFMGGAAVAIFAIAKLLKKPVDKNVKLLVLLASVPVVLLFLLSMPPLRSVFIDRYLLFSLVAIPILVGIGIMEIKKPWLRWLSCVLAGALLCGGIVIRARFDVGAGSMKEVMVSSEIALLGEAVIVDASGERMFLDADFYSTEDVPVYFFDSKAKYGSGGGFILMEAADAAKIRDEDFDEFLHDHARFWYVTDFVEGSDLVFDDDLPKSEKDLRIIQKKDFSGQYSAFEIVAL